MKRYMYFGNHFLVVLLILTSCKEGGVRSPINENSGVPGKVSNVKVENLHGGAKISYGLPEGGDILYVKAVVDRKDGSKQVIKSSYYKREIVIEGFVDTTTYDVQLYSVNRSEQESEPISVEIQPLTPPIFYILNSLKVTRSFGGAKIKFENRYEGKVTIAVLAKDSLGEFKDAGKYYTQEEEGVFYVHGYPPVTRKFGVYVRNRWGNHSDTVYSDITPLYEEEISKQGFKEVNLPTDTYEQNFCCDSAFNNLWDGITHVNVNIFSTQPGTVIPQWFTIDMGVKAKLNRFKVYSRWDPKGAGAYSQSDPKVIELWGSNQPDPDGSWDSWTKLGRFVAKKPSGSPPGQRTAEDVDYATVQGHEFIIPNAEEAPAVRYIRFKTVETWTTAKGNGVTLNELTFWGNIVK